MRIYLDHNATTPLRPEAFESMREILERDFGNPSSTHAEGSAARFAVESAREAVASLLGSRQAPSDTVFFTAGATEANNAVVRPELWGAEHGHVVSTHTEHPSVLEPLVALEAAGHGVTRVPVDENGRLDPTLVGEAIQADTRLVSVIWANNETGVVQPMAEIVEIAHERGVPVHADATQALGKDDVDVEKVPVDFLSASAHKLNGPKGVGCLYVRDQSPMQPWLTGGGQEGGLRGGTENVAGIAGFGTACALAEKELSERMSLYGELRERLWRGIEERIGGVRRNGLPNSVLVNTLNIEFRGVAGEVILQALDLEGISVSAGAACHSGAISPSHVLTAMGRSSEEARGSLRFSVGHGVDAGQIDRTLEVLVEVVPKAREAIVE